MTVWKSYQITVEFNWGESTSVSIVAVRAISPGYLGSWGKTIFTARADGGVGIAATSASAAAHGAPMALPPCWARGFFHQGSATGKLLRQNPPQAREFFSYDAIPRCKGARFVLWMTNTSCDYFYF